ncbi:MAG: FAD-binding oxidoreductase [Thiothrix sp.]|nr:FAD-binding oxidoreductase [Thiothrix sp.]HPQ94450.1 FAD-binding oxidoreductase [Thiolinea sp.]
MQKHLTPHNLWQSTCRENLQTIPLQGEQHADLAIIGGGFTGCAAALHAAEGGARVLLLEAQTIGHGGSGRNVGLVNAGLWLPPDDIAAVLGPQAGARLTAQLGQAPARVFALIERYRIACEAVRAGTLHCAHSAAGLADLRRRHAQLARLGAPVTLLDAGATARRTGSRLFRGALLDARAGTIQPLAYVRGLARAAQAAGAVLHEHSALMSARYHQGVWALQTGSGQVRAERLLLATNAYRTPGLDLPLTPVIPVFYFQMATRPLPAAVLETVLPDGEGCWDTAMVMTSFRRDRAGRLIVGAMGRLEGLRGRLHADWSRRKLAALYPQLAEQPLEHAWYGRIGMTSDHIPRILTLGPKAYASFGYSGRGIGPGTLFGEALAEALLDGDESGLPLLPVPAHREPFARLRETYYETGAALVHALTVRQYPA